MTIAGVSGFFLMRVKSDTAIHIKNFLHFVKTQYQTDVIIICSGNGPKIFSSYCSNLFKEKGILHQFSCVGIPQQNGVAERKHHHA